MTTPEPANLSTPLAWALRYAEIGWHVLPVEARGKVPIGRLVPRGMLDATTDQETIRRWWVAAPHANIGISLAQSGLVAVDVDPRNGGTETFERVQAEHGSLRSDVMAFTGGGGEHHVFVVPPGVHVSLPGTLGPGVDLKCNGYIVVEPSIHPSGTAYGWEVSSNPLDGVAPSPLPDWMRNLRSGNTAPSAVSGAEKPVNAKQARDAREALYVLDADDYHTWIHAGMALHSTGWGAPAYAMWASWAQQSSKFDGADSRKKWEAFKSPEERGNGITLAWVFSAAQSLGWKNPASGLAAANDEPPEWLDEPPIEIPEDEPKSAEPLPLLTLAELKERAGSISWLVKHTVPLESIGVLFGGSGTFKSFIALDMALHIAHGMQWLGKKTRKAPVIFIAAEGGAGLWRRIDAWHRQHCLTWDAADIYVVPVAIDLAQDCCRVIDAASKVGVTPGLVVVDTMSQTFSGEENSAQEVSKYLRELGMWMRDHWQCAVLVIHHSGHMATERPRGSSAIRANVDFMFGCHRDEKEMLATLSCAKQKDGELFKDIMFSLAVCELDKDEDDESITALVAHAVMSEEEKTQRVQEEAARGRSGRNAVLLDIAQNGMRVEELRKAFYEAIDAVDSEAKRQAWHRAVAWAKKSGLMEFVDGYVLLSAAARRDK